jgi:peptide/nickel transport system permease protein
MKRAVRHLIRIVAPVLLAALASAFLVRYSPGALVDERELNQRLSEDSLSAMRAQKARESDVGANFVAYLKGVAHGELGYSESNHEPVARLIADRAPATLLEMGLGIGGAWLIGLGLAIPIGRFRGARVFDAASSLVTGLLLSLPAALLAYLCLAAGVGSGVVLMLALAPRIFRFARNLLVQAYGAHHVEMARARGIRELAILRTHILPDAAPQLWALLACSVSMSIGAAIPVEAICGTPGLGRLAWQAAMARDLPLLVNLTVLITLVTTLAMLASEIMAPQGSGGSR